MTTTAKGNLLLHADMSLAGAAIFGGSPVWNGSMDWAASFLSGVALNQFDLGYMAERTVAGAANDDIDLNGVLTDALGQSILCVELAGLLIINRAKDGTPNTTNLTIGLGSNPVVLFGGTTPTSPILRPGAAFFVAGGDPGGIAPVVAGTADILRVANSAGATAKYQIAIFGRSA